MKNRWRAGILVSALLALSMLFTTGMADLTVEAVLRDNVVMKVGSNIVYYYGSGGGHLLDPTDPSAAPYLKEGHVLAPVSFLGGTPTWDGEKKAVTLNLGDAQVIIRLGEKTFEFYELDASGKEVPETKKTLTFSIAPEMKSNRVYIPLREYVEIFGYQYFYDSGLIVVGEAAASLDKEGDRDLINQLLSEFSDIKVLGSKEKLVVLLGFDPEEAWEADSLSDSGGELAGAPTPSPTPSAPVAESATVSESKQNAVAATEAADSAAGAAGDYSQTNTQVENVDEADIIKTDGEFIYYLNSQRLELVRAYADGRLELMAEVEMEESFFPSEMFVDGDRLVVMGTFSRGGSGHYYWWGDLDQAVKTITYDITDKKVPKELRSTTIDGSYLSSRRIGDYVYLIATKHLWDSDILPAYSDSAVSPEEKVIDYPDICYFPIGSYEAFVNVVGFNIRDTKKPMSTQTFLGSGENVYMSEENLYIASVDFQDGQYNTGVYKFAVSGGEITFGDKGSVPGNIINQFSMDEHKGYFRIGTTVFNYLGRGTEQTNSMYVLDSAMNVVGREEGIAPGERIYSVRFMGDRAYMVTFKQTDPLFALDMSDPKNPKVMGALKIPGYSNYLHPYDENHLIGFGRDTTLDEYGNAYDLGMKLSLFDVTDIEDPKEMFVEFIGDRGTSSSLLSNHKALMFSKEKGLLAFPVTLYEKRAEDQAKPLAYGEFVTNAAYVYEVSLEKGFNLKGIISHLEADDKLKASSYGGNQLRYIDRIIYIRDYLYTLSGAKVQSNDMKTLEKKGEALFTSSAEDYDVIIEDVIMPSVAEPAAPRHLE